MQRYANPAQPIMLTSPGYDHIQDIVPDGLFCFFNNNGRPSFDEMVDIGHEALIREKRSENLPKR